MFIIEEPSIYDNLQLNNTVYYCYKKSSIIINKRSMLMKKVKNKFQAVSCQALINFLSGAVKKHSD